MGRAKRPWVMPPKQVSPLLGYNNNVRHKGKVFHIQTEDSGVKYGHIITHLFMDGGRILKSVKTSYAEYLGNERMSEIVREMMKQQHKAMFIALRDGKFDRTVEGGVEGGEGRIPTQPFLAATSNVAGSVSRPPSSGADAGPPLGSPAGALAPSARAPVAGSASVRTVGDDARSVATVSSDELAIDIDAVERAAAAASPTSPSLRPSDELPPPPANLFREKPSSTGKYRVTTASTRPSAPGPASVDPPSRASASTTAATGGAHAPSSKPGAAGRRYAPTRPASIFGQARPQQGKSIFGDDLINDKSLDEVILSYLAEDLDEKK